MKSLDAENIQPTKIRYIYKEDPHCHLNLAHGVWGGVTSQGEIEMSFYVESENFPEYSEEIIAPDGSLEHEIDKNHFPHEIIRFVHSHVLLSYQTATSLREWLDDRISELEHENSTNIFDPNSGSNVKQ